MKKQYVNTIIDNYCIILLLKMAVTIIFLIT